MKFALELLRTEIVSDFIAFIAEYEIKLNKVAIEFQSLGIVNNKTIWFLRPESFSNQ